MRASVAAYVVVAALAAAASGCGNADDTNVFVGDEPTPTGGARTPTPVRTPTAVATPLVDGGTPMPTDVATATAVAPTTDGGATPTAGVITGSATPAPTAAPGGAVDADVQRIAADILPFLTNTALLTGGSTNALTAGEALKTDPCPDGGARLDNEKFPARTLTFQTCDVSDQLGSFEFDGTVVITLSSFDRGTIAFDFGLTDRGTNHTVDFLGTLALTIASGGFVLDGPLTVSTPEGDFTLDTNQVTVNANRKIISGSGTVTDADDNFDLQTVRFVVARRGASANLTVTFDDSSVHTYALDLATGALTQTS